MLRPPGAAFLDRDGTINVLPADGGYIEAPAELRLLPGAAQSIRRLNDARVKVIVVTNQRAIALGRLDVQRLAVIHAHLRHLIRREADAEVDDFFFCPHDIGTCCCRKPGVGMFLQATKRWPEIDLATSAMVGDSRTDIEAADRVGMTSVLIGAEIRSLEEAVTLLLTPSA